MEAPHSPTQDQQSLQSSPGDESPVCRSSCPYAGLDSLVATSRTLYCVMVKFLPTVLIASSQGRSFLLEWISKTVRTHDASFSFSAKDGIRVHNISLTACISLTATRI